MGCNCGSSARKAASTTASTTAAAGGQSGKYEIWQGGERIGTADTRPDAEKIRDDAGAGATVLRAS